MKTMFPNFCKNIRAMLQIYSRTYLSKMLKISVRQIENWANGTSTPNISVVHRVSKFCHLSIDSLMYHEKVWFCPVYKRGKKCTRGFSQSFCGKFQCLEDAIIEGEQIRSKR
jgi:transcriptional regulator with XRE-family HTH domain